MGKGRKVEGRGNNMNEKLKNFVIVFLGVFIALSVFNVFTDSTDSSEDTAEEAEVEVAEGVKSESESESESEPLEEVAEEVDIPVKEIEIPDTESQKLLEDMAYDMLVDNFAGMAEIEFNDELKVFFVIPTDPGFTSEVLMVMDGSLPISEWDTMVDSMISLSSSFTDLLGEGYGLALANPINPENTIVLVADGILLFDIMDEFR